MSSLAAARADGYYNPPDWDPRKGGLNKYHGVHALRERARKIDQGIVIIRFEMPFNVWCTGCNAHIGRGVRFNAEKKQVGAYHRTTIWQFSMKHHCGERIVIQTNPQETKYDIIGGAREKVERYEAEDTEVLELLTNEERAKIRSDQMAGLEYATLAASRAAGAREQVANLIELNKHVVGRDFELNRLARKAARIKRKEAQGSEARALSLGLPSNVPLLPESHADVSKANLAAPLQAIARQQKATTTRSRAAILSESIFSKSALV